MRSSWVWFGGDGGSSRSILGAADSLDTSLTLFRVNYLRQRCLLAFPAFAFGVVMRLE